MFTKQLLATDRASYTQGPLKYACDLTVRDGAQVIFVVALAPAHSHMGVYGPETWGRSSSAISTYYSTFSGSS